LKRKKLFNSDASDDNIRIYGGETTNLLNLENIRYKWCHEIFDAIYRNNWLPHKTSMGNDKTQFSKLTEDEQTAFEDITSFLVFLDSIQTNNLSVIASYITAPDVVYVMSRQQFDEAIHSKSYGWILSSLFTHEHATRIVYRWRENSLLKERIEFITNIYEELINNPSDKAFIRAVVANYMLEGLYFYNSFQFFHNLASRGLMIGSDTQIKYIQRDEIQHCEIFKHIINTLFDELPDMMGLYVDEIYEMFEEAVEWEIKFSNQVIGNKILGMTEKSIEDYTYYLANRRLKDIGMTEKFPKQRNPYHHLEMIAAVEDETTNRSNNFEVTSIAYKQSNAIDGWDDL
jgi:ribonucleoside-diphosphate reductase beta chain